MAEMQVCIEETWVIVDKWWLPKSEQIRREYAEVKWHGRKLIFVLEAPDTIWRIHREKNMSPQQVADQLDVSDKVIRQWLREGFPAHAPGQGRRWEVTPVMVNYCKMRAERR